MYRSCRNLGFVALVGLGLLIAAAPARADIEYSSGIVTIEGEVGTSVLHSPLSHGRFTGDIFFPYFSSTTSAALNRNVNVHYRIPGQPGVGSLNRFLISVSNPPAGTVTGRVVNWNWNVPDGAPSGIVSGPGQNEPEIPLYFSGPTTNDTISDVTVQYTLSDGGGSSVGPSDIEIVHNPEPGTLALFGLGLLGLGLYGRRRRNAK